MLFRSVITSNSSYYDRNAMPEGLLALTGNLTASEGLLSLEQEMRSRTQDPGGNHGLMFVSFADPQAKIQYHPIRNVPKDMVNSQFASLTLALVATRFGEDLGGLNMAMFGGSASNLGGGTSAGIRADEAKSTSFLPWMAQLCRYLNNVYAPILGPKWRVIWRGHERVDEAMFDLWKSVASVNEIRGFLAMDNRDDVVGDMPANNSALSQIALSAFKDGVDLKTGKVTKPPDAAPAKKKPAPKTGKANPKARGKIRIRKSF